MEQKGVIEFRERGRERERERERERWYGCCDLGWEYKMYYFKIVYLDFLNVYSLVFKTEKVFMAFSFQFERSFNIFYPGILYLQFASNVTTIHLFNFQTKQLLSTRHSFFGIKKKSRKSIFNRKLHRRLNN